MRSTRITQAELAPCAAIPERTLVCRSAKASLLSPENPPNCALARVVDVPMAVFEDYGGALLGWVKRQRCGWAGHAHVLADTDIGADSVIDTATASSTAFLF